MRYLFFLIFFWFVIPACWSQRFAFQVLNTPRGLPQSQVTAINQDKNGCLWVGTLGGLARYNGKSFQTFSTDDGLFNNRISKIIRIGETIWMGHDGGVSRWYNGALRSWKLPGVSASTSVSDVVWFKDKLVIATNGGGLFYMQKGKVQPLIMNNTAGWNTGDHTALNVQSDDDRRIRDLIVVNNELWLGTRGGVLKTTDLKLFRHIRSLDAFNVSSFAKQDAQVWFTTFDGEFVRFNTSNGSVKKVGGTDPTASLRSCITDASGCVWVASNTGVYRFRDGKRNLMLNASNGLPSDNIRTIFEDLHGNIWLGSEGKGLFKFSGGLFQFYNSQSGLSSDLILSVLKSKNGYWLGTYDKGILQMNRDGACRMVYPETDPTIWCSMTGVNGSDWFGSSYGLIEIKKTGQCKVWHLNDGLPGDKITSLMPKGETGFYVGGEQGVSVYMEGRFKRLPTREQTTVRSMCKLNGTVYCAGDKGLYQIIDNTLIPISIFRKPSFSLASDGVKKMWIGTEDGLYKFENGEVTQVKMADEASSRYVNFVYYENGKLFVGTNNGLYVSFHSHDRNVLFTHFGLDEGLVDLETNLNSFTIGPDGRAWFGTASGLVTFQTNELKPDKHTPGLMLKKILANYQEVNLSAFQSKENSSMLEFPFRKNTLTFELDPVSLNHYEGLHIQYRLDGGENSWSPLTNNSTITFDNLAPGMYTLHARAIHHNGGKSRVLSIPFVIKTPFYRTWWFITLVAALLISGIWWVFSFWLRLERDKNEREKLESTSRLLTLEQRSLNASMNRHFIFNSLNSIQYFINTQDRVSANRYLTNFAKLIRKNLDTSEEGNIISLKQEIERLDLYLSLECMRFKDRFEYSIRCDERIDTEGIQIPAMLLQPFIENSIIHGILPNEHRKGEIDVDISMNMSVLTISITDNGMGIDASMESKKWKDGNHRSQGMELIEKRMEIIRKLTNRKMILQPARQLYNREGEIAGTRVVVIIQAENLDD
jgi:ligand-binding sensor domain-containing protein